MESIFILYFKNYNKTENYVNTQGLKKKLPINSKKYLSQV